jgi:hypothetical protein
MVEPKQKASKTRQLLQKHRRWFPFVGVVIALATFFVREVMRDEFKDLAATVDSSESLFIINEALSAPPDYVRELANIWKKNPEAALDDILQTMEKEESYIKASIDTTKRLVERLPGEEQRFKGMEELQLRFIRESIDTTSEHVKAVDEVIQQSGQKKIKHPTSDEMAVVKHFPAFVAMAAEAKKRGDEALALAEDVRKDAEYRYAVANKLSMVLVAVGLLLAFVGRVFGVEGVEGE